MRNKEPGIIRASLLDMLCIIPETSELEMLIACAILSPRVCAIIGDVVWDIATINGHSVGMEQCVCTEYLLELGANRDLGFFVLLRVADL